MRVCAVEKCKIKKSNEDIKKVSFHGFPRRNPDLCQKWISVMDPKFHLNKTSTLCSKHFKPEDFYPYQHSNILREDAVPTLHVYKAIPQLDTLEVKSTPTFNPLTEQSKISVPSHQSFNVPPKLTSCKFPYTNDDHTYSQRPLDIEKQTRRDRLLIHYKKIVKALRNKNSYQSKKIETLKESINDLKNNVLIPEEGGEINSIIAHIKSEDVYNPSHKTYSEEMKRFAIIFYHYSPQAYKNMGTLICLPSEAEITEWCLNENVKPGFLKEAFDILEQLQVDQSDNLYFKVTVDEISIKRHHDHEKGLEESVDMGQGIKSSLVSQAKSALFIMAVSVNNHWKLPLGYFLVDNGTAELQVNLIKEALELLEENGIMCKNMTCDGIILSSDN